MKSITLWAVRPAYNNDGNMYYQVLPYNLKGTIFCHYKFYNGLQSLIPFLKTCRLTRSGAEKLKCKLQK